jgi:type II secretory ATPase GspE/PulE/Tfp pilus assembly ATPase PilB-like protein
MDTQARNEHEEAAKAFAAEIGLEYFDTRPQINIKPLIGLLTHEGMRAYGIVPLDLTGTSFTLGLSESTNRAELEPLKLRLKGYEVKFVFISLVGWQRLMNRYFTALNQDVLETGDYGTFSDHLANIEPKFMFEPVAQLAYQLGASDIHLEPGANEARLRFRVDGTLHPIITIPRDRYDLLTSDLQMRASVKWGADIPQGGRVNTHVINAVGDEIDLNMRLETIPSLYGQDVVIRLFNISTEYLNLESLHLTPRQLEALKRAVAHPRGMVLAVGPTGSGKTSTLYSIMNHLNQPEVKIVTLEDPIEYELDGISQVPVHTEDMQSFSDKLRAVLREDPDTIMIGEIRDADTAKTALQAALTGHLVLSTFHASSSAAAIIRLMDMIGQNPLLSSAISLIMAQRLVRRLCMSCRAEYSPSKEEILEIKTALSDLPQKLKPDYEALKLHRAVGCPECHNFGFHGRINIVEQLEMTPPMIDLISKGSTATTAQAIEQAAKKDGMITLIQDGVMKALAGVTTLEEVYRALGA